MSFSFEIIYSHASRQRMPNNGGGRVLLHRVLIYRVEEDAFSYVAPEEDAFHFATSPSVASSCVTSEEYVSSSVASSSE